MFIILEKKDKQLSYSLFYGQTQQRMTHLKSTLIRCCQKKESETICIEPDQDQTISSSHGMIFKMIQTLCDIPEKCVGTSDASKILGMFLILRKRNTLNDFLPSWKDQTLESFNLRRDYLENSDE